MWTLESSLPFIRSVAAVCEREGFSVAGYGSVLVHGQSANDLDLYFIRQEARTTADNARYCVEAIRKLPDVRNVAYWNGKVFRIELKDGRRIDGQFETLDAM